MSKKPRIFSVVKWRELCSLANEKECECWYGSKDNEESSRCSCCWECLCIRWFGHRSRCWSWLCCSRFRHRSRCCDHSVWIGRSIEWCPLESDWNWEFSDRVDTSLDRHLSSRESWCDREDIWCTCRESRRCLDHSKTRSSWSCDRCDTYTLVGCLIDDTDSEWVDLDSLVELETYCHSISDWYCREEEWNLSWLSCHCWSSSSCTGCSRASCCCRYCRNKYERDCYESDERRSCHRYKSIENKN